MNNVFQFPQRETFQSIGKLTREQLQRSARRAMSRRETDLLALYAQIDTLTDRLDELMAEGFRPPVRADHGPELTAVRKEWETMTTNAAAALREVENYREYLNLPPHPITAITAALQTLPTQPASA